MNIIMTNIMSFLNINVIIAIVYLIKKSKYT